MGTLHLQDGQCNIEVRIINVYWYWTLLFWRSVDSPIFLSVYDSSAQFSHTNSWT